MTNQIDTLFSYVDHETVLKFVGYVDEIVEHRTDGQAWLKQIEQRCHPIIKASPLDAAKHRFRVCDDFPESLHCTVLELTYAIYLYRDQEQLTLFEQALEALKNHTR